jgi:hypothetical protein
MKKISIVLGLVMLGNVLTNQLWASGGAASSGGLSLITEGNARAAGLGKAYTAAMDDIAGMAYNPAAPAWLSQGQASFLLERGLIEDSYGQIMVGMPNAMRTGGFGLSVGYYNAGTLDLVNENGGTSSVKAQEDMTASLAYSHKIGNVAFGVAGKYLHSELAQAYSASAEAIDAGILAKVSSRLSLGAAALNYGTKLTYLEEGDNLPRTLRMGGSYLLFPNRNFSTSLLFDASYMSNEKELSPALGLETLVGPLAIRGGLRKTGSTTEFSAGAGFALGSATLDYAFGLINNLDSQHKVSLAMHFGPSMGSAAPTMISRPIERPARVQVAREKPVKKSKEQETVAMAPVERNVAETPVVTHSLSGETILRAPRQQRRVYVVQEGDTLASIAQDELGDKRQWKSIYSANKHLIDDPAAIEVGMRIVIPTTSDNQ